MAVGSKQTNYGSGINLLLLYTIMLAAVVDFSLADITSGSGMGSTLTPCPDITEIITDISSDLTFLNVSFNFTSMCESCMTDYNYIIVYFSPTNQQLFTSNTSLSCDNITDGYFIVTPHPGPTFEMGIIIQITLIDMEAVNISDLITIPGEFSPSVTNLTAGNINDSSVTLSWELPFPNIQPDNYSIEYTCVELSGTLLRTDMSNLTIDGSFTTNTLVGLMPFSSCEIDVSAIFGNNRSDETSINVTTREGKSSAVRNIMNDVASSMISWEEPLFPAGRIINYIISIVTAVSDDSVLNMTVNTSMLSVMSIEFEFNVGYIITIVPVNGFGMGISNSTTITIEEKAPSPPLNFTLSPLSSSELKASWEEPTTLNGILTNYSVSCRIVSDQDLSFTLRTTTSADNTSDIITGLEPFTNYECYVTASTGGGESNISNSSTAMTNQDIPSGPPMSLIGSNSSSTSLFISWMIPLLGNQNGEILGYNITYFALTNTTVVFTDSTSDLNINITSLMIYTVYNVSVAAYTSVGTGPSTSIEIRTDSSVPTAPLNVTYKNISSTSVEVSWDEPTTFNGPNEGYEVRYTREETSITMTIDDIMSTSVNISDLEIYEVYTITVLALSDKGVGESSQIIILTDEDVPGPSTNVTLLTINSSSLLLSWLPPSAPNGIITGYTITYTLQPLYAQYLQQSFNTINVTVFESNLTLTDLHAFAGYDVTVRAETRVGLGEAVMRTGVTLGSFPSGGVVNLTAMAVNSTSVNVSWLPPSLSDWNGILTSYNISYTTIDANVVSTARNFLTIGPSDFNNVNDPRNLSVLDGFDREFVIISNLHEFVHYEFNVTVATDNGPNPSDTPSVSETTLQSAPSGPPTNVNVTVLSSLRANISWDQPLYLDRNGIIRYYLINITDTLRRFPDLINTTNTSYIAENLTQFDNFTVSVAGGTIVGVGPYSDVLTQMTFEGLPSPPLNINGFSIGATSVTVTWETPQYPNGIILGYRIFYIGSKTDTNLVFEGLNVNLSVTIDNPSIRSYTISGLLSDTVYKFNVTAFTSTGSGSTGIGPDITLPVGPPPTLPTNVALNNTPIDDTTMITQNSIPISFVIPASLSANGPIIRVGIIPRIAESNNDEVTTYYESSMYDPPSSAPGWIAVIEMTSDNQVKRRGLTIRQTEDGMTIRAVIGGNDNCGLNDVVCNGPLRAGTSYRFKYRAYTTENNTLFADSAYSQPISTVPNNAPTIAAAILVPVIVIIIIVVLIIVGIVLFRKYSNRDKYLFASKYLNGNEELISTQGSPNVHLKGARGIALSDPTIVPLAENVIVNQAARTPSVKAIPNSRKVYLRDFAGYVEDMLSDSSYKFSEEYEKVSNVGLDHSKDVSLLPENRAKNRYTNILAYDHSRVKLDSVDDEMGTDYINANYIPGYRMRRAYIATQGPLPSTFEDFWRMVWEQNCYIIVMLTQLVERGRTKCHRYWPGSQPEVYDDICVDMISEKESTDWIIRKFNISKEKRNRMVLQYQFVSWPDHGVPDTPTAALDFVQSVHGEVKTAHGPVIVHCSAGVGRTGTFIALGTLMQHVKDHDWVDIFGLASEMRQHRNHMIQTEAQYVFIHKAMLEVCAIRNASKPLSPIYGNIGMINLSPAISSQQSDMYGDLLSEEVTPGYRFSAPGSAQTNKNNYSYEESKF